jgi:hypothetical protein
VASGHWTLIHEHAPEPSQEALEESGESDDPDENNEEIAI